MKRQKVISENEFQDIEIGDKIRMIKGNIVEVKGKNFKISIGMKFVSAKVDGTRSLFYFRRTEIVEVIKKDKND